LFNVVYAGCAGSAVIALASGLRMYLACGVTDTALRRLPQGCHPAPADVAVFDSLRQ
jgi:hypothetical protein